MQPRLYWQIHRISFILEKLADEALRQNLDIGFAQFKVLEAIHHNELAKQNLIAELLDQTEASISRQIKILQKKGLIHANSVMGNKRAKELSLTRVGEDIVRQSQEVIDMAHAKIFVNMSSQDQQKFNDILEDLIYRAKNSKE